MGHEHQWHNLAIMHNFLREGCYSGFGATKTTMYLENKAGGPTIAGYDFPGTPDCSCVYAVPQCQQDHAHALTDGTLYFQVLCPNTPSRPSLIPW